ncbi:hypothetical protein MMC22_004534 [Lobaria immixta]|nr:hypothetical protein [Lobaria immixta]
MGLISNIHLCQTSVATATGRVEQPRAGQPRATGHGGHPPQEGPRRVCSHFPEEKEGFIRPPITRLSGAITKSTRAAKKRKMDDESDKQTEQKEEKYLPTITIETKSDHSACQDDTKEGSEDDKSEPEKKDSTSPTMMEIYDEELEHELDISEIDKTFPPRGVALSDYNVGRICDTRLRIADCTTQYPFDFDSRGLPLKTRESRGKAMYTFDKQGELCFAIVCGSVQLHGASFKSDLQLERSPISSSSF